MVTIFKKPLTQAKILAIFKEPQKTGQKIAAILKKPLNQAYVFFFL